MPEPVAEHKEDRMQAPNAERPEKDPHLVITVHGIRTNGTWQDDLKKLLEAAEPGIMVANFKYRYFSSIAFLIPPLRWVMARQFRKFFVHAVQAAPENARIDLVAHSFGTYLAASALRSIPERRGLNTIIFAGSVLSPTFPWYKYLNAHTVKRLINECGWNDSILLLCQFTALMMGMAGRVGFTGLNSASFVNRYYRFGHGGYFDAEQRFMSENWVPLLTTEAPVPPHPRPELTTWGGLKLFLENNLRFIKVACAVMMATFLIWLPVDWRHKANYQRQNERFAHIAKLVNATKIPGSDPTHVKTLLKLDLSPQDSDRRSLDLLMDTEETPGGDDLNFMAQENSESLMEWLQGLFGLGDEQDQASLARLLHAKANYQLAAGKQGRPSDRSKANQYFEDAIRAYKKVSDDDPAHGSYALCLMDYARLQRTLGLHAKAIAAYQAIPTEVFHATKSGEKPAIPVTLLVDSMCGEAATLKEQGKRQDALKLFWSALQQANEDPELTSYVNNEIAWLFMEDLEVGKATQRLQQAKDACERLIDHGQFIFKARLFHIRHGLALALRLKGHPKEAFSDYEQIIVELKEQLRKDRAFTPKERHDLWDRLVNSLERKADIWLFARTPEYLHIAASASDAKGLPRDEQALLKEVECAYQDAIDEVGNEEPVIKTRLLYKKVMAHLLGTLGNSVVSDPKSADVGKGMREPVDIEFREAERTFVALTPELRANLKLYQQVASAFMDIHRFSREADGQCPTQHVAKLRSITKEYVTGNHPLDRDQIETLLVATEILLEPGVAPINSPNIREDAARMLAILGNTKAPIHDELQTYSGRFYDIAATRMTLAKAAPADEMAKHMNNKVRSLYQHQGRVIFLLRLSPTKSLVVAESDLRPVTVAGGQSGEFMLTSEPVK
jgi:tetratricopeptide (TPR) repeat protein